MVPVQSWAAATPTTLSPSNDASTSGFGSVKAMAFSSSLRLEPRQFLGSLSGRDVPILLQRRGLEDASSPPRAVVLRNSSQAGGLDPPRYSLDGRSFHIRVRRNRPCGIGS